MLAAGPCIGPAGAGEQAPRAHCSHSGNADVTNRKSPDCILWATGKPICHVLVHAASRGSFGVARRALAHVALTRGGLESCCAC